MRRQNAALCAGVLMVIACCVAMAARNASGATNTDEAKIRAVLDTQVDAWNRGDVDTFMAGNRTSWNLWARAE